MTPDTTAPGGMPELAFNVLLALGEGPRHGYAIILDIQERTGRETPVRSGSLYATLQTLHDQGLVEAVDPPEGVDQRRRYFRLTRAGRKAVAQEAERLAALVRRAVELNLARGL